VSVSSTMTELPFEPGRSDGRTLTNEVNVAKRHANPKPDQKALQHLREVAREAFPGLELRFCSHGDLGGHRAPRDHTLAFRLFDSRGKVRSNVVWVMPQSLMHWTAEDVRSAVDRKNGK
jgi:hypothetical protein